MERKIRIKLERIVDNLKHGSKEIGKKMMGPSISFAMGFGLGKLGRATGHEEIMAVPIAMDLSPFGGGIYPIPYLFYCAGISVSYFSEIYQFLQNC